jgi:hypothetical protein
MYKFAQKHLKYTDAQAGRYAFLRGNLYTQFAWLRPDRPRFAKGPIGSTIFMFRRYSVKAIEQGINEILRQRNWGTGFKWLAVQGLLGGANTVLRVGGLYGGGYLTAAAYKAIRDYTGSEETAKAIHYGLPYFIGADWSYSLQMIDVPLGRSMPEQAGRLLAGVPGQLLLDIHKSAMDMKGPEPTTMQERVLNHFTRRVPSMPFRAWEFMQQLDQRSVDGYYDFKDPAGRVRFRGDLQAALAQLFVLRPLAAAEEDAVATSVTEIWADRSEKIDEAAHQMMMGKRVDLLGVLDWNMAWPEFHISLSDIKNRTRARLKEQGLTRSERMMLHAPKVFRRIDPYQYFLGETAPGRPSGGTRK